MDPYLTKWTTRNNPVGVELPDQSDGEETEAG